MFFKFITRKFVSIYYLIFFANKVQIGEYMLPEHGEIECRICFNNDSCFMQKPHSKWKMINDPGAWGSNNPEYLVLGFSKGSTQVDTYEKGKFEDVAFAGMRPRLTEALRKIGILNKAETVDDKIKNPESNIAFGSLIRCSLTRIDEKVLRIKGKKEYTCTGKLINKSFKEIPDIINNCTSRYLKNLPSKLKAVFLLGNSDIYVKNCRSLLRKIFPGDFKQINPMAIQADNHFWLHLSHPSGLNGHFNKWLNSNKGTGKKRIQVQEALKLMKFH